MSASQPLRAGFDLGGTGTRGVVLDDENRVLATQSIPTPRSFAQPGEASELLADLTRQLLTRAGGTLEQLRGVGIGASGPVDPDGVIRNPDTLPAFTDLPLPEGLGEQLGVPVTVDNDAVTALLAEAAVGAGRDESHVLMVTLGTGVGVAVLQGGRPLRGGDGMHPEAGHQSISVPTDPCYCGRDRCFEQAASRSRLQRDAAGLLGLAPTDPHALVMLAGAARAGRENASMIFRAYGRDLGTGLGDLLAVLRSPLVVLGGSAAVHLELFRSGIEESLGALGPWISRPRIEATDLGDEGGALGAALLVG